MSLMEYGKKFAAVLFSFFVLTALSFHLPAGAAAGSDGTTLSVAPDFDLQDIKGSHVTLSQFKGQKPVLLYFWATWCHFCMAERPAVIQFRKDTPGGDIEILAINVGSGDSLDKVRRFEEKNPAPYTVLYDPDSKVTRTFKVEGIPHFIFIDKAGEITFQGSQLPSDPKSLLLPSDPKSLLR